MKTITWRFVLVVFAAMILSQAEAQFKDQGLGGGVGFGGTFGNTELRDRESRFLAYAFLRYELIDHLAGQFGVGLGRVGGPRYLTQIIPVDYHFVLSPFSFESWNPYIYAGAGALHFQQEEAPPDPTPGAKTEDWTAFIPGGLGLQIRLDDRVSLEASGGYNYTLTDDLNTVQADEKDAYFNFLVGLTVAGESGDADPDGDGLSNREEKQLNTNPNVGDTDGDELLDGAEVKRYNTNPLQADSDSDGLNDGKEVSTYRTDPGRADTDGDRLNDGDEVTKYTTDPLKADTDGEGLGDGDEVLTHTTDPLKADTDGGTVNDGTEVARGGDPKNPSDDVPKKEELKVEVGKAIVLEGIVFATGKADITPESESNLEKAYNTLAQNPEIAVEIHGHTDNTGSKATNMRLSQARAESVKAWLVNRGIASERIVAKGFGPDRPVGDNDTREGRQMNRRIEFFRTK